MAGVFNNLMMFDQPVKQSSVKNREAVDGKGVPRVVK